MKKQICFVIIALIALCFTSCSEDKQGVDYAYSVPEMAGKTLVISAGSQTRKMVFDKKGRISADYNYWLSEEDRVDYFYDYSKYPSCIYRKYSGGDADTINLFFEGGKLSKSVLHRADDEVWVDYYSYNNGKISEVISKFKEGKNERPVEGYIFNWSSGNLSSVKYKAYDDDSEYYLFDRFEYTDMLVSSMDTEDRIVIFLMLFEDISPVPLLCISSAFLPRNLPVIGADCDLKGNKRGSRSWRVE